MTFAPGPHIKSQVCRYNQYSLLGLCAKLALNSTKKYFGSILFTEDTYSPKHKAEEP